MTDLVRLLDSREVDDFERDLLEAGAREAPSPDALRRTLDGLGIRDGAGPGADGAGSDARPSVATTRARLATWIGLAIVAAVTTGVVANDAFRRPASRVDGPAEASAAPSRSPVAAPPAVAMPVASAPPVAPTDAQGAALPPPDTSPGSSATKPVATKHAPAASSTASDVSSLAAEIAALDRARGPLQSGDASGALHALDDYARAFPHGVMSHEATVLRIEALVKAGNIDAARALAKRFLAQNPKSPHAQRIRRLVGEE